VFASTRIFYAKLLQEFALQRPERARIDDLILEAYPRLMGRLLKDAAALPEAAYAEIRFETFVSDPLGELARLYETLSLGRFVAARPRFDAYLGEVRDYRAARHPLPTEAALQVAQRWARFIERWGYAADELDGG
jgi:omega-hydroxy-beta-dihydromenaquinone-9 sulfotransferase